MSTLKKSTSKKKSKGAGGESKATTKKTFLNIEALQEALAFMKTHDLAQFEYRVQGVEIALKFNGAGDASAPVSRAPARSEVAAPVAAPVPTPASQSNGAGPKPDKKTVTINCPFVGTFYRSPGPNQDSFVEVGQIVDKNQALCIIEAMKLMNEIESDTKGRIVKVLVDNATPVEFGEPLFELEPL